MMQSVGEVMAIGRTFPESLQKALRSLETGRLGLNADPGRAASTTRGIAPTSWCAWSRTADARAAVPASTRRCGAASSVERLHEVTGIDPWFLDQMLADRRGARAGSRRSRPDDADAARLAAGQAARLRRRAARVPLGRPTTTVSAARASPPASQSRTRPSTPARPSSRRRRRTTTAPTRTRTRSRRSPGPRS